MLAVFMGFLGEMVVDNREGWVGGRGGEVQSLIALEMVL